MGYLVRSISHATVEVILQQNGINDHNQMGTMAILNTAHSWCNSFDLVTSELGSIQVSVQSVRYRELHQCHFVSVVCGSKTKLLTQR